MWRMSESGPTGVEVDCAACGRFAISREQLEEAVANSGNQEDRT